MKERGTTVLLFLTPNLVGFLLFTIGPIFFSILLSFFAWDLFSSPTFVGLDNFTDLLGLEFSTGSGVIFTSLIVGGVAFISACALKGKPAVRVAWGSCVAAFAVAFTAVAVYGIPTSPKFWQSIGNTLFLLIGLPVGMLGSLFLAVLLNEKIFAGRFFRLTFFLPSIVGGVGIFLLWKWIFNPYYGPLNTALQVTLGITGPAWFEASAWAKPAMLIMNFWSQIGGGNMILYLAALQSINPSLYEAAQVDGANALKRFFHITLPMVSPTSAFILIMGIINGFQGGFDAAYVITGGGPAGSTTTVNYFIFESAFKHFEMGRASAASVILFVIVLGISWINWKFFASRNY